MKNLLIGLMILVFMAAFVIAVPYGPTTILVENATRAAGFNESVSTIDAQAGNVSLLVINTSILTDRWQGYYGNISGKVRLDDANGWTMYAWDDEGMTPAGWVFASNNTVGDWTRVFCVNFSSNNVSRYGPNTTHLEEDMYGATRTESDGVDETFSANDDITVGTRTLLRCPSLNTYQNDTSQTTHWNESILWENDTININTTRSIIYAAEVNQNTASFNNQTVDFQMIVGEDGDDGSGSVATSYYFYVELT